MEERQLIYDWNSAGGADGQFDWTRAQVDLNDETLRDGLQSPSVTDPSPVDSFATSQRSRTSSRDWGRAAR